MKFLRNLVASIFGTLIALGLIFMLFVGVVAVFGESEKVTVKNNSVLEINLEPLVKDYAPKSDDPFAELFNLGDKKLGLNEILNAIENAKSDENIKGLSIKTLGVNAGIAQMKAIRDKLLDFKEESGKFVLAYGDFYDQRTYYLASVADSIYLNPMGQVDFIGLSTEILFYGDLQEKTGVKMEVIRHGKYKSAVEPFLYSEMSTENREQITSFLQSIWNEMVFDIAESRSLTAADLNAIADNLGGRNANMALENKLVDAIIYEDEYGDILEKATSNAEESSKKPNYISLSNYISTGKGRIISSAKDRIAVIYAQGEIIYGAGNEDIIGQDLIIDALKEARKASNVKAIVLRVNSPGGSALASELIWREIELTKEKLPVVVSMGDLAASGGYYIACNANHIFAEPTTITGSIGVFGIIPNVNELAKNVGINAEQVNTNKGATYSLFEPMSDNFRAVTTEGVEQIYTTFVQRVASGRNKSTEEVDAIAQGRVWSGAEALEIGLIDDLGNLDDAVQFAAELAGTTDYRVRNYPNYTYNLEDQLNTIPFMNTREKVLKSEMGDETYRLYQNVKQLTKTKGVQARMPFIMQIK
jgi:protease-4